ncbi:hypothetical protein [Kitasatospora albolonga]|uniref:hypothetical protein n=1 Tax=Kitasatospora albolonga TaxID=68173 RepID=UPI0035E7DFFA
MPRPFLVVPLVVALVAGFLLGRAALVRWRDLKAAQTYELTAEQRPLLVRAGGAVLCGMCVTALTVAVVLDGRGVRPAQAAAVVAAERPAAPPVQPSPSGAELPPVVTRFELIGRPAGGELMEGEVAGPDGRPRTVRVWLPDRYRAEPQARFPVVVLHAGTTGRTADAELPDVFEGVASAVKLGRSRPFVLVAPAAPAGTGHPCELVAAAPQAIADDQALRTAVGAAFRTLPPGPGGWGVLGVEGGAACAAAAGLARPDLYGAAAAVSGRYDGAALAVAAAEAPEGTAAKLLLAAAKDDAEGLGAARGLQKALKEGQGRAAKANVRLSDAVRDFAPERERLRLVRVAVQYLAENLTR